MNRDEIVSAIHQGIREANDRYEAWSNGWWITDAGVEGVMVTTISEFLHEKQLEYESLHLELGLKELEELSNAKARTGPSPKELKGNQRADIVLFNGKNRPIAVIEVKRLWDNRSCAKDLRRIAKIVDRYGRKNGGTIQRGFLAFMQPKNLDGKGQSVDESLNRIEGTVRNEIMKDVPSIRFDRSKEWFLPEAHIRTIGERWGVASCVIEVFNEHSV